MHVIHQRLQELKNGASPTKPPQGQGGARIITPHQQLVPPLPVSTDTNGGVAAHAALPPPMSCFQALEQAVATATTAADDDTEPCEGACPGADKPQLDLREFLQQIGVLKDDEDAAATKGSFHGDGEVGFGGNGEFDWDALAADLNDIAGGAVGVNGGFQMDDLHEVDQFGSCLPIPVWDV